MRIARLLPLVVTGALSAQYVSPSEHARAEGLANNVFPFGNTAVPFRFAQVHDDIPTGAVTGFAFRHNMATVGYAAHSVTVDLWCSTAVVNSATMTTTFDNNHGADKAQVITGRTYNHPASNNNVAPTPFSLRYPFDVPFVFSGGGASLCWETHVTAKTQTTSITHDAVTPNSANPSLQVGRFGVGCRATGASAVMAATGGSTAISWAGGTGTLRVTGSNAPANAPIFLVLGTNGTNWSGLPLPFELPGTNSAPSGSCWIYTDVLYSQGNTASGTGASTNDLPVPLAPHMRGLTTRSQLLALDLAANGWGFVTSPVVLHNFVPPTGPAVIARAYLSGSLGGTASAVSLASTLVTQVF